MWPWQSPVTNNQRDLCGYNHFSNHSMQIISFLMQYMKFCVPHNLMLLFVFHLETLKSFLPSFIPCIVILIKTKISKILFVALRVEAFTTRLKFIQYKLQVWDCIENLNLWQVHFINIIKASRTHSVASLLLDENLKCSIRTFHQFGLVIKEVTVFPLYWATILSYCNTATVAP